jgi:hypothetical protein
MGWSYTLPCLFACIGLLWGDLYLYTGAESVMAFCLTYVGDRFLWPVKSLEIVLISCPILQKIVKQYVAHDIHQDMLSFFQDQMMNQSTVRPPIADSEILHNEVRHTALYHQMQSNIMVQP